MSESLWLRLDSPQATVENVGGKGASLATLARAGLPVPTGFLLTTAAYRDFVAQRGIAETITRAQAEHDAAQAARLIQPLFIEGELPADIRQAIAEAHDIMDGNALAVRSSATAEDLPEASFAGQMESYLHIVELDATIEAIRGCWASLWTQRAIEYRARQGIAAEDVALAVAVQRLVEADAAGVMFTANPLSGDQTQLVIDATWGLGESLVSGGVTPDHHLVDAKGTVLRSQIGDKATETVCVPGGTAQRPVPEPRRHQAVLDTTELSTLTNLGGSIARLYGRAMDIEWARDAEGFVIVQARPITKLPTAREVWNDSLTGDYLWTAANLGEAIPSVMTPITWSLVRIFMSEVVVLSHLGPHRMAGNIGGRFYLNLSLSNAVAEAVGLTKLSAEGNTLAFGQIPTRAPRLPERRWRILTGALTQVWRFRSVVWNYQRHFSHRIAAFPDRCQHAHSAIAAADSVSQLRHLWTHQCEALLRDGSRLLSAGARLGAMALVRIRPWLRKRGDESTTNALLTGLSTDGEALASLGPLLGLRELADGEIDRATFQRRWGHRCPDEFEVSVPRPYEDPEWIDRRLAGLRDSVSVTELLARQDSARAAALEKFSREHPRDVKKLRRWMSKAAAGTRGREAGRSEVIRAFGVLRAFVSRAGELTGLGGDVFMLNLKELLSLLDGDESVAEVVAVRRATYEHYRALPVYPTFIRGAFDPQAWAADPHRRADFFDATSQTEPTAAGLITGGAGSFGTVEGVARVIDEPDAAVTLRPGEILVTKVTNVGWTPVFPRAAAVVTDIGAVLSHAAIVARELGIPAVVGCGDATTRIHSGDRIKVNGDNGTVEIMDPDEPA